MTQRVLVTAGASGIGREIARSFIGAGASVFVCDIDNEALAHLEQCQASSRPPATWGIAATLSA